MRTPVDEQLIEETSRYSLKYSCEDCVHFAAETGNCSLGYPNASHLAQPLKLGKKIIFCKEFDLV